MRKERQGRKKVPGCRRGCAPAVAMPACLRDTSPAASAHMQSASGSVNREGHEAGYVAGWPPCRVAVREGGRRGEAVAAPAVPTLECLVRHSDLTRCVMRTTHLISKATSWSAYYYLLLLVLVYFSL
jgi:hypothetical protein